MANIKVSEMTEATTFGDNDYTMIVQSNSNKKINKANLLNGFATQSEVASDISDIESEIDDIKGTVLFENTGQSSITLSESIANYKVIEIWAKKSDASSEFYPIQKFYTNNEASASLLFNASYSVSGGVYCASLSININGVNVSPANWYSVLLVNNSTPRSLHPTSIVEISKIVGYK